MARILEAVAADSVLVTIPQAPADRLDAVVRACAAAGVPCRFVRRETDLDPVAVLGATRDDHCTDARPQQTLTDRLYTAIPLIVAFLWLCVLYGWQTRGHVTPWLFTDELKYTHIARSIADTGQAVERHHTVSFDTLYTYFIAPFWWIHNVHSAYAAIKYFGVISMTTAIFPAYWLARMVVSRPWALFAAVGAVATPALAYGAFIIKEPLAYPACALAFCLITKALVERSRWWILGSGRSALFAMFVRGQLAILIVVYALAALFLAWTSEPARRWRATWSTWDWVGFVVLGIGAIIVFSAWSARSRRAG